MEKPEKCPFSSVVNLSVARQDFVSFRDFL